MSVQISHFSSAKCIQIDQKKTQAVCFQERSGVSDTANDKIEWIGYREGYFKVSEDSQDKRRDDERKIYEI